MCFFNSPSEAMLSFPAVLYGIFVEQIWKKVWIGKSSTALSDLTSPFANCAFASFLVIPILFISTSETTSLATSDPSSYRRGILRSEEHTSELQSRQYLVCRLLLE